MSLEVKQNVRWLWDIFQYSNHNNQNNNHTVYSTKVWRKKKFMNLQITRDHQNFLVKEFPFKLINKKYSV